MTTDKHAKHAARQLAQREGISYTAARRQLATSDATLLDPEPDNPKAQAWCPTCRYTFILHTGGRCPEPAVMRIGEQYFDGPHWGGYLHTHGVTYCVTARADGGRGPWLAPEMALGGPPALEDALRLLVSEETEVTYEAVLNVEHLQTVLDAAFPGIRELDWWPKPEADTDVEPVVLESADFTRDCDDPDCCDGDW